MPPNDFDTNFTNFACLPLEQQGNVRQSNYQPSTTPNVTV